MKAHRATIGFIARRMFAGAFFFWAAAASAQDQSSSGSWLAFTGCWTPTGQEAEDPSTLCIVSGDDRFSAEFLTMQGDEIVSREVARADGRPTDATQEGCEGTTTWLFSGDGHRVYHRSEHLCDGAVSRKGTGMMVMLSPVEWMDVSSVEVGEQVTPWVQRYRLASMEAAEAAGYGGLGDDQEMALNAARVFSTTDPTLSDVVEASRVVHPETVQAWLVETGPKLAVDARELIRMADAGVPSDVIDVVVAVAHPEHFRLHNQEQPSAAIEQVDDPNRRGSRRSRYYSPFGLYGYGYSPYGFGYSPYGYGYSPYGSYSPYGYGSYYGYRPVVLSVSPRVPESQRGSLVKGRGYVRGGSGGGAMTAGRDGGRSSAGVSSGGSGSGRQSSGRTARRRGGGS